ncbi:hypothetical protein WAJ35_26450, partial [Acinetobacter baumannii]
MKKKARRAHPWGKGRAAGQCLPGLLRLLPVAVDGLLEPDWADRSLPGQQKTRLGGGLCNPS